MNMKGLSFMPMRRLQMSRMVRSTAKGLALSLPLLAGPSIVGGLIQGTTALPVAGVAYAEEQAKEKPATRRTQALNNKVYEKLQAAQKAIEEKNVKEALSILDDLQSAKKLNDYELANVLNLYAFIYYSQENYAKAVDAYKKIIGLAEAPEGTVTQARYSLAQLYFVTEQYREGVDALKAWFAETESPGASAYMLMAQGLYQLKDYNGALKNVETAISMYKESGKVPKENWYGLQRFLYYEKDDFKKVIEILDELLVYYPKKQYWIQLSAMWGELKNDSRQLASLETAYVQGLLDKDKELVNLTYLYMANEVPYKAAKVLDKAINEKKVEATSKSLELLGNAWRAAQEVKKAIPEMAKAASKSDSGDLWARLCNIYLDNDEFKNAVEACDKGLAKGGVKRPDTAYLVKGMAYFNLKQYEAARKAFLQAAKDERSKSYADQWLKFMEKELERQRSLEEV